MIQLSFACFIFLLISCLTSLWFCVATEPSFLLFSSLLLLSLRFRMPLLVSGLAKYFTGGINERSMDVPCEIVYAFFRQVKRCKSASIEAGFLAVSIMNERHGML